MVIEVWLDGPRGERARRLTSSKARWGCTWSMPLPSVMKKLMGDGLRDHVVFNGSGGFRTWGDIVKGVAMGLDGVILGTGDLVAIGCVRDRNCESGCRSGISTIDPRMQLLRDVELNKQQIINFRATLQAQITRAIAALGMNDIRELRGRYDTFTWPLMEARVEDHRRRRAEVLSAVLSERPGTTPVLPKERPTDLLRKSPSDCGVAAIVSNHFIRVMSWTSCSTRWPTGAWTASASGREDVTATTWHHYGFHVLVKGRLQSEVEEELLARSPRMEEGEVRRRARENVLTSRKQAHGRTDRPIFQRSRCGRVGP